jgi:capsular exopolysaccharide synthesis family protein
MEPANEGRGPALKEVHLRDYWKIAWQGRWVVLAVFFVVLSLVTAWTFLQTPVYRGVATVEIQPQARRLAPGQDVSGIGAAGYGWFAEEKYQNTQIEVIKSRSVAERAFRLLGLSQHPMFAKASDPVGSFLGMIKVEPRRETGLIEIAIESTDAAEAARWANAVADTFVDRNLEKARDNARAAVKSIEKLLVPIRTQLSEAEKERLDVLQSTKIYNPENQTEIVKQRQVELNAELNKTQIRVASLRSVLAKVEELKKKGADPSTLPDLANDTMLQELYRQKVQAEKDLESARVVYKPGAPQYLEKESQKTKIEQKIAERIDSSLEKFRNDYALAVQTQNYLTGEIRKSEEDSYRVGIANSQYGVVKTDAETRKQIFDVITKTMNEISVGADLLANNVAVLDHAPTPLRPIRPSKRLNLFLGSVMGLFLGLGAVFFLDYLDNTFRSPEDIEKYLGLSVLAVVPKVREAGVDSHAVRESYQTLRTSVIFCSRNRERRLLLVTSTAPQEGKSSTVVNLARTLASAGERVVLLDCDLRRPTLHQHFQIEREPGITNYLAGRLDATDWRPFVRTVDVPNLHVVPCGPIPPSPPELFGTARFRNLLHDLKKEYDWVLVDSPPLTSLSDSTLLASIADMVVLVVKHNATDRDLVTRSIQQLRNVNDTVVGVVLNNVDIDKAYQKDYYYAGYYYYGAEQKKKRRKIAEPEAGAADGAKAGVGSV